MEVIRRASIFSIGLIFFVSFLNLPPAKTSAQNGAPAAAIPELKLPGLRDKVTVRRDDRGIPYIEAKNETDLYMAQGYVTASDRLWQMDLLRRSMRGELSEIFGRDALKEDQRHRILGFAQLSEAMFANSSQAARTTLEAYARGVNAFTSSRDPKQLPSEFGILQYVPRPWTPADSLIIGKLFAESLSTTWESDIVRAALQDIPAAKREMLLAETSPLDVLVVGTDNGDKKALSQPGRPLVPYSIDASVATLRALAEIKATTARTLERVGAFMDDRAVSNNWVVSGKRTASGKAMLANDPHLRPAVPSIWYMTHLNIPGMRVAGVTAPGAPGIILGHNDYIAWGATNLGPDVQDLYLEKFDPQNPRRYSTPTGWRDADVRHEEIKVRKSFTEPGTETVGLDVTVTRHGPIFFERDGARYALRWTTLDPKVSDIEAFISVNRARNWNEFRKALSAYRGPTQNFVYADVDGHIGYCGAGMIPIRKSGDGSTPYDGSTDDGEWTGTIPFDGLPQVFDPPDGFIVTANQRVAGKSYRYFLTHEWASPFRARRIYELIQAKPKLTVADFREIQGDTFSIGLSTFAREVVKLAASSKDSAGSDEGWSETLRLLGNWNGRLEADSNVAPLVVEMRRAFRRRVLEGTLGQARTATFSWAAEELFLYRLITEQPREWLPAGTQGYLELIRASEKDARAALTKQLGADTSKWTGGNYRPTRLRHPIANAPLIGLPFAIAPFPQNGGGSAVNVGPFVSMRLIATPENWDETLQGIAPGESGDPASAHWKDQLPDWLAVTPRVFPFSSAAVERATKSTIVLVPGNN